MPISSTRRPPAPASLGAPLSQDAAYGYAASRATDDDEKHSATSWNNSSSCLACSQLGELAQK